MWSENFQGVVAGLLVQNTLKFLLNFGHVTPYLVNVVLILAFFSSQHMPKAHSIPFEILVVAHRLFSVFTVFYFIYLICRGIILSKIISQPWR